MASRELGVLSSDGTPGFPWPSHSILQRDLVLWGALRGSGGPGRGCRAPLPCAVPLLPAARAALGCFCTTHPAAGLVSGESLHHVQAVGLCPPVQAERGEAAYRELLTSSELSLLHSATKGTSPATATDSSVLPVLSSSPANGDTGPTGLSAYTCTRASPACLELQLLFSGAEGMLHLMLGNGLPLP